jgi:hypothetical protein
MWKNIVETNIMVSQVDSQYIASVLCLSQVGTHVDSLIATSMIKGVSGFDEQLAYQAVYKDATV